MNSSKSGLRLRFLSFFGPQKPKASVTFGSGLNVLYGASDTGKSFVVEAIDFMLGGKPPLREVTERIGYDRILLGIETLTGESFTILRSVDGGGFRLYTGLYEDLPGDEVPAKELSEKHSDKSTDNLSAFLLSYCDLSNKRVRRNVRGDTNSLSFRNIARLLIVTETEITQQRSPLSDGNAVSDTSNLSTFRLLLTGVDDSALLVNTQREPEELSRDAQLQLLNQLLDDYRDKLKKLTKSPDELTQQLQKIDISLMQHMEQLNATEAEFQKEAGRRRNFRKKLEEGRDRRNEINSLLERFSLLEQHYCSDMERLRAIEEGGTLFSVLGTASCPLCGAEPAHYQTSKDCEGNIEAVIEAARQEITKIEILRSELDLTVKELARESKSFDIGLPILVFQLEKISVKVDRLVSPKLATLRSSYAEFTDKRGKVLEALALLTTVQDIERRRINLEKVQATQKQTSITSDIPSAVADGFAQSVESILTNWHFPEAGRVYFDSKARDLVIAGKPRGARGKGLRAITHAAFTLGLLSYCRAHKTPHPGFVILDSPLLAYREPDGKEDDLTGTDLKEQFYSYLQSLPSDWQVIVVENTDPPLAIKNLKQVQMFSKNPHSGRYGLFPYYSNTTS
jgi:hypothetical protein